jgi:hypothetical protein
LIPRQVPSLLLQGVVDAFAVVDLGG